MTGQEQELLAALRVALTQLEEWEVTLDGEFGSCRNLDQLEKEGALSEATLATRTAIAKAEHAPSPPSPTAA
jgi:hypothetical protein